MNLNTNYCCIQMKMRLNAAQNERGFYVVVTNNPTHPNILLFVLEIRSVARIDEPEIGAVSAKIAIRHHVCISNCPWCGINLNLFYGRFSDRLTIVKDYLNL